MKKNGARKHYAVVRLSPQNQDEHGQSILFPRAQQVSHVCCNTSTRREITLVSLHRQNAMTKPHHNNALPKVAAVETKHLSCSVPGRHLQTRWMATVVSSTSFYVVANQEPTQTDVEYYCTCTHRQSAFEGGHPDNYPGQHRALE